MLVPMRIAYNTIKLNVMGPGDDVILRLNVYQVRQSLCVYSVLSILYNETVHPYVQ